MLDTNTDENEFSEDKIISSEVMASQTVSIFKLFPSDCITLYKMLGLVTGRDISWDELKT